MVMRPRQEYPSASKPSSSGSNGFGAGVLNTTKYLLGFGPRKSVSSSSSDLYQSSSSPKGQGKSRGSSTSGAHHTQEGGMLPHIKGAAGKPSQSPAATATARNSITRDRGETNLVSIGAGGGAGKGGGTLTCPPPLNPRTMKTRSSAQTSGLTSMMGGMTLTTPTMPSSIDPRDRNGVPLPRKSVKPANEYQTGSSQSWSTATMFASMSPYSASKSSSTVQHTMLPTTSPAPPHAAVGPASSSSAAQPAAKKEGLCCDKCDGKHETENCPHYKKARDDHIDAKKNGWKLVGGTSNLPGAVLRSARVVSQLGDGSCLFHSLSYGIKDGSTATTLRRDICEFILTNPTTPICETPLSDWVKWDSGTSCADYARKMSRGSWGGGIEMACMSRLKGCNVHVYERDARTGGYKRISAFDHPKNPEQRKIVRVLYRGGVHYDAIVAD